jgi:hypothetical protein
VTTFDYTFDGLRQLKSVTVPGPQYGLPKRSSKAPNVDARDREIRTPFDYLENGDYTHPEER